MFENSLVKLGAYVDEYDLWPAHQLDGVASVAHHSSQRHYQTWEPCIAVVIATGPDRKAISYFRQQS